MNSTKKESNTIMSNQATQAKKAKTVHRTNQPNQASLDSTELRALCPRIPNITSFRMVPKRTRQTISGGETNPVAKYNQAIKTQREDPEEGIAKGYTLEERRRLEEEFNQAMREAAEHD